VTMSEDEERAYVVTAVDIVGVDKDKSKSRVQDFSNMGKILKKESIYLDVGKRIRQ